MKISYGDGIGEFAEVHAETDRRTGGGLLIGSTAGGYVRTLAKYGTKERAIDEVLNIRCAAHKRIRVYEVRPE